jgi:hypothetical protein
MMPNDVEASGEAPKASSFMLTFDINSKYVANAADKVHFTISGTSPVRGQMKEANNLRRLFNTPLASAVAVRV